MARGNGRMSIFLDDTDYRQFVHLLGDVVEDLEIQCWNYCVMPNHFHATLCPTLPNLSEALRRINGRYAQCGTGATGESATFSRGDSKTKSSSAKGIWRRSVGTSR
jgi:REP element-mobilizing transposase RayT